MISLAWISMSVAWPWKPAETWWIRIFEFGQRHPLALGAAGQQQRAHAHRDPDADRLHVGLDELHRVVDRQAGVDRAAGRVDVEADVLVGVLGLQVQELGDDQVGDVLGDRRAEEDDPLAEQARVDVESALAARGLLDDHRYQGAATTTTSSATASSARRAPRSTALHEDPDRLAHAAGPPRRRASSRRPGTRRSRRSTARLAADPRASTAATRSRVYLGNPSAHNLAALLYGRVLLQGARHARTSTRASTVDQMPKQVSAGLMFGDGAQRSRSPTSTAPTTC